jgi:hypothetical protein
METAHSLCFAAPLACPVGERGGGSRIYLKETSHELPRPDDRISFSLRQASKTALSILIKANWDSPGNSICNHGEASLFSRMGTALPRSELVTSCRLQDQDQRLSVGIIDCILTKV